MILPPGLVQYVERHGCFSGCYSGTSDAEVFTAANQPPARSASITCQDCLKVIGVLSSLLPAGTRSWQLADAVTAHVRAHRGYSLSLSGYHTNGPGFWFSAVYWASCGLFLLDGERSRNLGTDLDLLILAFKHGVLKRPAASMMDPKSFKVGALFVDPRQPMPTITSKVSLLNAKSVSVTPMTGWKRLTLAEFAGTLPQATPPAAAVVTPAAPPGNSAATAPGQRCPKCGQEFRQRSLLNRSFFGCMC